jgi:Arc/MetJ-type ribon-helix-helix transcriptional regulator
MKRKRRAATTIRLEDQDKQAIQEIKDYYGISSDSDVIRFLLREKQHEIRRQVQAQQPPPPPPSHE